MYSVDSPAGGTKFVIKGEAEVDNHVGEFPTGIEDQQSPDSTLPQGGESEPSQGFDHKLGDIGGDESDKLSDPEKTKAKRQSEADKDTESDSESSSGDEAIKLNPDGGTSVINKFASELLNSAENIRNGIDEDVKATKLDAEKLRKEGKISEAGEKLSSAMATEKRLIDIDKLTATLLKRDREMREVINMRYKMNRKNIQNEIKEMKQLYSVMVKKKRKMPPGKESEDLGRLIARMKTSMSKYVQNVKNLDAKMKQLNLLGRQMDRKFGRVLKTANQNKIPQTNSIKEAKNLNDISTVFHKLINKNKEVKDTESSSSETSEDNDVKTKPLTHRQGKKSLNSVIDRITKMLQEEKDKKKKNKLENTKNAVDMVDENTQVEDSSTIDTKTFKRRSKTMTSADDRVKVRITTLDEKEAKKMFNDDMNEDEAFDKLDEFEDTGGIQVKLRKASKKMEEIVKSQLEDAGLKIGSNIKVKIITNKDQLKKIEGNPDMQVLSEKETSHFKDMIMSLLGGGHERTKVEKHQKSLEDNYRFTLDENDKENKRTENDDDAILPMW